MENRFSEFPVVLLAGGKGSRVSPGGRSKGLVEVDGHPWLEHQLQALTRVGLRRLVIVLGYQAEEYFDQFPAFESAREQWVRMGKAQIAVIVNPAPHRGPFTSIQAAGKFLPVVTPNPHSLGGIFLIPVDVPVPSGETWNQLADSFQSPVHACVPVHEGSGGHPVLVSAKFMETLLKLPADSPDSRLDRQIHFLPPEQVRRIPVRDFRVGVNMNGREDFDKFRPNLMDTAAKNATILSAVETGFGSVFPEGH